MKTESRKIKERTNTVKQMFFVFITVALLIGVGIAFFLNIYNHYDNEALYAERLNQMQEVTEQLFSGLEDVVNVQWDNARYECNFIKSNPPATIDEMLNIMKEQSSLAELDNKQTELIAIDAQGRYYYPDGKYGLLTDMNYLEGMPEQLSYVFDDITISRARMLFLYRLDDPIVLQADDGISKIIYYGIAEDMEQLNPYFDCKAYNNNNSTYVVDSQGLKLFSGSNKELLKGFNVFSVLRSMSYLHGSSFDDTLQTMHETGLAYSNAVLDGEEYYYALYQMDNSEWILLFLVPSSYVATNTVRLVNTTTKLLMVFAVFMAVVCTVLIYIILRIQQRKALHIADEANAMLEAKNRELELAQAKTAEALHEAEAASKAKTDFLSNMSHDIRTPMNAIVGITKLMAHDKSDPVKINTYIRKVQQSSQHLLSLINDVLDMSKIESGNVILNKEYICLADQIGQVESIVCPQIEERRQKFTIRTHNITHEHLIGDAVRLRQIFINLLSNAIKYTPNGGNISLDVEELPCEIPDKATIRISVTDSGYGMTPEFLEHIFEPFVRAESSTTNKVQGTGLGMAITKNIVDMAGGKISVQSEADKGSRFTVDLPLLIDRDTKTLFPFHSVMLITNEDTLIDNARAAFKETDVSLTVARSEAEVDDILRQSSPEILLLGSRLNGDTLAGNVHRLRNKAENALMFYCCNHEDWDQLADTSEMNEIDGLIARPFFLSSLAVAIDRIRRDSAENSKESISVLNGMRFLCAEDNELNAEILKALLEMKGATGDICENGEILVHTFANVKPGEYEAILMDVQMPIMNGLDATKAIRKGKNPLGKSIPIIAMTANAFSEDVQSCLDAGMDAHVSKPIDITMLEHALQTCLNADFRQIKSTTEKSDRKD